MDKDKSKPVDVLMSALPELALRHDAAAAAGVNVRTIDRWRSSGLLTTFRQGGPAGRAEVRVSRSELVRLLCWEPDKTPVG